MITLRRAGERGTADHGWLQANFTFSFAGYYDPQHMGFRVLRVLNDDRIAPGKGFGPHAHRDMEIITYVLEGGLRHRDSTGEHHILRPNEVQTMSAGTGIVHSEFNASEIEPSRSIQIWITPDAEDVQPAYQQIGFRAEEKRGRLRLLAAPVGTPLTEPATVIHQDAYLYVTELKPGEALKRPSDAKRHFWVQAVCGAVLVNGQTLEDGDGAAVSAENELLLEGARPDGGELLLFDLP
jgi:redox-sensitive bicupin YhaK (pirin superfamily)